MFLDRFQKQVIIDEIQYAPSLFRDLKIKVDENRDTKGRWILIILLSPYYNNPGKLCFYRISQRRIHGRKRYFYFRDSNGLEIDFIAEKKVIPLLACNAREAGLTALRDLSVYNPLFGFIL